MAGRIRTIKPEMLENPSTAGLSADAFRLFMGMILLSDDHGNLRAEPAQLYGAVFWRRAPAEPVMDLLAELAGVSRESRETLATSSLVSLYRAKGSLCAHLNGWSEHQKVDKPGKPRVPLPETGTLVGDEEIREILATVSRQSRDSLAPDHDQRPTIYDRDHEDSPAGAGAPSDQPLALVAGDTTAATAPKVAAKKRLPREKPAADPNAPPPPAKEPPPFSVDRAVDLVAAAAPTRFARPAEIPRESRINIALRVRAHPTEDQWTWLGAYLEAGGHHWMSSPGIGFLASNGAVDALAAAAKWHAAGRPDPTAKTHTSKRPSGALDPSMTGNTPDSWGF